MKLSLLVFILLMTSPSLSWSARQELFNCFSYNWPGRLDSSETKCVRLKDQENMVGISALSSGKCEEKDLVSCNPLFFGDEACIDKTLLTNDFGNTQCQQKFSTSAKAIVERVKTNPLFLQDEFSLLSKNIQITCGQDSNQKICDLLPILKEATPLVAAIDTSDALAVINPTPKILSVSSTPEAKKIIAPTTPVPPQPVVAPLPTKKINQSLPPAVVVNPSVKTLPPSIALEAEQMLSPTAPIATVPSIAPSPSKKANKDSPTEVALVDEPITPSPVPDLNTAPNLSPTTAEDCEQKIQTYWQMKVPKEKIEEFLKLQSKITLNRLAWAYLSTLKSDNGQNLKQKAETTILALLKKKADPQSLGLKDAIVEFEKQPLSRHALTSIAPYLSKVLAEQDSVKSNKNKSAFLLNESDLKMIDMLTDKEGRLSNDRFDERFSTQTSSNQSVLNLMKIVNSAYSVSKERRQPEEIEKNLGLLQGELKKSQDQLNALLGPILDQEPCLSQELGLCDINPIDRKNILFASEQMMNIAYRSIKRRSDMDVFKNLRYGSLWLKVAK